MPNFSNLIQVGKSMIMANRPELLLGAAVAATVGAVVLAAQGGYKSGYQVRQLEETREAGLEEGHVYVALTKTEILAATWTNYAPAAGVTIGALASTLGLHIVHVKDKRQLVAAGLAAVEEAKKSARVYTDELKEAVNKHTTPKTQDKINNDLLEKSADRNNGVARLYDDDGVLEELYLCRDIITGRDIWSNQTRIKDAVSEINGMLSTSAVELNQFYDGVGLAAVPDGDTHGWNEGDKVEARWSTTRRDDGRPVVIYTLYPNPTPGYEKSHG